MTQSGCGVTLLHQTLSVRAVQLTSGVLPARPAARQSPAEPAVRVGPADRHQPTVERGGAAHRPLQALLLLLLPRTSVRTFSSLLGVSN